MRKRCIRCRNKACKRHIDVYHVKCYFILPGGFGCRHSGRQVISCDRTATSHLCASILSELRPLRITADLKCWSAEKIISLSNKVFGTPRLTSNKISIVPGIPCSSGTRYINIWQYYIWYCLGNIIERLAIYENVFLAVDVKQYSNNRFIPNIDSNRWSKNNVEYDRLTVRFWPKQPDIKANLNFYKFLLIY